MNSFLNEQGRLRENEFLANKMRDKMSQDRDSFQYQQGVQAAQYNARVNDYKNKLIRGVPAEYILAEDGVDGVALDHAVKLRNQEVYDGLAARYGANK